MSNESGEYVSGNCLMGMYTAQLFMKAYGFEPETCQIQVLNETYAAKMSMCKPSINKKKNSLYFIILKSPL